MTVVTRKPNSRQPTDKRYKTKRWLTVRKLVLNRDLWACQIAPGCPWPATVADHISPVYPGMPDSEFYSPGNLRAGCREHNLARAVDYRMELALRGEADPPRPPRTIFARPRVR